MIEHQTTAPDPKAVTPDDLANRFGVGGKDQLATRLAQAGENLAELVRTAIGPAPRRI